MIYAGRGSQKNWLSYGLDDNLDKWSKPEVVPNMRRGDPDCWLNGDTYYAASGGRNLGLMKSSDLKNWQDLGDLLHADYPADLGVGRGTDISCPNMFKIGNKWMLLCIDHGMGCRYYLGDFKDEKYLPEFHALMNWQKSSIAGFGGDYGFFYAPETLLTKDGRRVMWAWLMNGVSPRGVQSLPRELELPEDGVLRIKPLRELAGLRYDERDEKNITVRKDDIHALKQMAGDTLELEVKFKAPGAREFGVDVFCDEKGENGLRIAVVAESKQLRIGTVNAPFELKQGEAMNLRVYIDRNLVEIFGSDAFAWIAWRLHPVEALPDIRTRLLSSNLTVEQLKLMLTALAFIDAPEAADTMVTLATVKDFPLRDLAFWWLMNRMPNDWKQYDIAEVMKKRGLSLPAKAELIAVEMPPVNPDAPKLPPVAEIAKLAGDATRGATVAAACYTCHRTGDTGVDFGPDLTTLGKRQPLEEVIRAIAEPSAAISHGFEGTEIKTKDGLTITGIIVADADLVIMKCMGGLLQTIPKSKVQSRQAMRVSLMYPPQQFGLDAQAIADIAAFLMK